MAAAATERRLARNSRCAALAKARDLPGLHAERLHDAVAGDGFVKNVLDVGQFVLSLARGLAHPAPDPSRREDDEGNKQQQHPGQFSAQQHHHERGENQGKELLQEFRQHARHGELHALDVVDDGRNQCAGGVLLKKRRRTPQDGVVEIIAQVGDHAEPGVVHQVSAGVIENSLQDGGGHQREGHHRPGIVKVRRNKLLQVDGVAADGNFEQLHLARSANRDSARDRRWAR